MKWRGVEIATDPKATGIMQFAQQNPLAFGAVFTACKTTVADIFVQFAIEGKSVSEWDYARTRVFALFGFGFMGIGQYFLIGKIPSAVFPPKRVGSNVGGVS